MTVPTGTLTQIWMSSSRAVLSWRLGMSRSWPGVGGDFGAPAVTSGAALVKRAVRLAAGGRTSRVIPPATQEGGSNVLQSRILENLQIGASGSTF